MKPYFTKYIPVEGEIKEGDTVLCTEDNSYITASDNDEYIPDLNYMNAVGLYEKVKLFLCSRDIQVGDKFFIGKNPQLHEAKSEDNVNMTKEMNTLTKNNCFKVIGEVSPNAIFVKEGMEFDEDDIQFKLSTGAFQHLVFPTVKDLQKLFG